jgi:uncharacterized membrane protein
MNLRPPLFDLAIRYRLDGPAARRLFQLAGLDAEPAGLDRWLPRGTALLAAALAGLGLILWVAANWDALGRIGQFALLQGLVLAAGVGALVLPAGRPALGLLALLAIGGLLAFLGQTYQTGADPWQLFAWWCLLALPLAFAVRSDVLWTPWALVAMTAIALWAQAHGSRSWAVGPDDPAVLAWAWGAALLVVGALGPAARRFTGAGLWSLRLAATLAVALVTFTALSGLFFGDSLARYGLGLLVLTAAALVLVLPRVFELGTLSAVVLGLDTLLTAGLGHWLFREASWGDDIGRLFVLGLFAAGLLALSVTVLLRLAPDQTGGRT